MINRNPIECVACGRRTVTRTAIGHGEAVVHAFPCAGCNVPIVFRMTMDQANVTFAYDPNPTNGRWLDSEDGCEGEVVFDAETLGLKDGPPIRLPDGTQPGPGIPLRFSPFIETFGRFRDIAAFKRVQTERFRALRAADVIGRLLVHFESGNWSLFDSQVKNLGFTGPLRTPSERIIALRLVLVEHQTTLVKADRAASFALYACYTTATAANRVVVNQFCDDFRTSKRLQSVWTQLAEFRRKFLSNAFHMMPVLQRAEWTPPVPSWDETMVYNKQFDALKALYIEGFELFARLSVLFLALHGIGVRGSTDVPTKKGKLDIWEFERLANANKSAHLVDTPGETIFSPHLDTLLRNGVGHFQAHYDAVRDTVVLYKQQGAVMQEFVYSYAEFVDRVLTLCSTLLEVDALVFYILEQTNGRLL